SWACCCHCQGSGGGSGSGSPVTVSRRAVCLVPTTRGSRPRSTRSCRRHEKGGHRGGAWGGDRGLCAAVPHDVAERQRGGGVSERSERTDGSVRRCLTTSPSVSEVAA